VNSTRSTAPLARCTVCTRGPELAVLRVQKLDHAPDVPGTNRVALMMVRVRVLGEVRLAQRHGRVRAGGGAAEIDDVHRVRSPALAGTILGIPAGAALFAIASRGGTATTPPAYWLMATVVGTVLAITLLTAPPGPCRCPRPGRRDPPGGDG
jgi:hypothetical protein